MVDNGKVINLKYIKSRKKFNGDLITLEPNKRLYFLIHGYQSSPDIYKKMDYDTSIINHDQQAKVIYVDWTEVTKGISLATPYWSVVREIEAVALALATLIKKTVDVAAQFQGLAPLALILIGHSLGAHVAGGAGYQYQQQMGNRKKINLVIGLDAAGVFIPDRPQARISLQSGERVVAIHSTNAGKQTSKIGTFGLGWYEHYGHEDIYIYKDKYLWGEWPIIEARVFIRNHNYPVELLHNMYKNPNDRIIAAQGITKNFLRPHNFIRLDSIIPYPGVAPINNQLFSGKMTINLSSPPKTPPPREKCRDAFGRWIC